MTETSNVGVENVNDNGGNISQRFESFNKRGMAETFYIGSETSGKTNKLLNMK